MHSPFVLAFAPGVTPGKWVTAWKQRVATTPIELRQESSVDAIDLLRQQRASAALVRLPIDPAGMHVIVLYEEQAVVVASIDHPISAFASLTTQDLAGESVLSGDDKATVELVAANVGVAIMPQSLARLHSRRDVVARPLTDHESTRVALVWPDHDAHPLVDDFIGIVRGRTANSSRGTEPKR